MKRRSIILLTFIFLLLSLWIVTYFVITFKSVDESSVEFENVGYGENIYRNDEPFDDTHRTFSRTAKADLIEEVLLCLADSLTPNKTTSKQGVVLEFLKRTESATVELTQMEFAYKGLLQELQQKDDVIDLLSQPMINFHEFEYIHNPKNVCSHDGAVRYLFVVPSAPVNFDRRSKFRESSLYKYVSDPSNKMKLLFFLGKLVNERKEKETREKISKELLLFNDIVQEDYDDTYHNIRFKAVAMLRWAITFCSKAKFVIRTDDDVTKLHNKIFQVVENTSQRYKNFILGNRMEDWAPHRNMRSKYYLSMDEFPHGILPPFAIGGLLAYPISTVSLLYQAALRIKPVWLDDVFITGICAPKVGVPLLSHPVMKFEHPFDQS